MITRRGLLRGVGSLLAAPAIVRVASLMPISVPRALPWFVTPYPLPSAVQMQLAELLAQSNDIIEEMVWRENLGTFGRASRNTVSLR